ncbi:MAG: NAD(+)/NADH kinase [Leptospiraceae bacterium]|nr:NAD(+)/NADH kinase [Leptospiraceae bacterium]
MERAIIVRNKSSLEEISSRFSVKSQAEFYIEKNLGNFLSKTVDEISSSIINSKSKRGSFSFKDMVDEDSILQESTDNLQLELNQKIKTKIISRDLLPNFIFSPNDMVIAIGRDGLVANVAKYAHGIPIMGVNPEPERYDGILLPFTIYDISRSLDKILNGNYTTQKVTMAEASLNDGQKLLAFNDLFIGPRTHTSARYSITYKLKTENQSSSGIIVSTGAGSTGWMSSLFNMAERIEKVFCENKFEFRSKEERENLYRMPWDSNELRFVVREPFESKISQINICAGKIIDNDPLIIESNMSDYGIIFSDGVESDFLHFNSGSIASIGIAKEKALLINSVS